MEFGEDAGQPQLELTVGRFSAEGYPAASGGAGETSVNRGLWKETASLGRPGCLTDDAGDPTGAFRLVERILVFQQLDFHLGGSLVADVVMAGVIGEPS